MGIKSLNKRVLSLMDYLEWKGKKDWSQETKLGTSVLEFQEWLRKHIDLIGEESIREILTDYYFGGKMGNQSKGFYVKRAYGDSILLAVYNKEISRTYREMTNERRA